MIQQLILTDIVSPNRALKFDQPNEINWENVDNHCFVNKDAKMRHL